MFLVTWTSNSVKVVPFYRFLLLWEGADKYFFVWRVSIPPKSKMQIIDDDSHFNRIPWSTPASCGNDDVINNSSRTRVRRSFGSSGYESDTGNIFSNAWTPQERCDSCPRRFSIRQPIFRFRNDFLNRDFVDSDFTPISVVSGFGRNDRVERFRFEHSPKPEEEVGTYKSSLTRLGGFWNLLSTNFLTKVAQLLGDSLGCFGKQHFLRKILIYILGKFWINLATFHSNIWAHCLQPHLISLSDVLANLMI